jgi:uncharacterized protein
MTTIPLLRRDSTTEVRDPKRRPRAGRRVWRIRLVLLAVVVAFGAWVASSLPAIGANALLHPLRLGASLAPPVGCLEREWNGAGVVLRGWQCAAVGERRGTLVYLHGVADTRASGMGLIERFVPRGFDVVAYDSRAHGESEGDACTYGFYEKQDLRRVLDTLPSGPVVLFGASLGGSVALQAAEGEPQVSAIVAIEPFADLEAIVRERAPFFLTEGMFQAALRIAEQKGRFEVRAVSPERAAAGITAPVLLVHGANDVETRPEHSQRIFEALGREKRLIVVPGAGHNATLRPAVWGEATRWIDAVLPPA